MVLMGLKSRALLSDDTSATIMSGVDESPTIYKEMKTYSWML